MTERVERRERYDYECCCITFHDSFGVKHSAGRCSRPLAPAGVMAEVWPTEVLFFVCIPAHIFHTDKIIPSPQPLCSPLLRPVHSLAPLFHQLDPGASARPLLGTVQSRFKSLFFAVISPYTSAYVSALPETPPLSRQQRLQLLLLALGGFAAIQTRLLLCRTFRVDCFCLYFHNLNKGFISFKSVSQPKPSLIMQWQQTKYSVTQPY